MENSENRDGSIEFYRSWVKTVETYKDKHYKDKWQRAKRFYLGRPKTGKRLIVNITLPTIQSMIPMLYYQNPYIFARPAEETYQNQAQLAEALLNYQIRELKLKREVEDATLDTLIFGVGIIMTGWEFTTESVPGFEMDELIKKDQPYIKRISPWDFLVDVEAKDMRSARLCARRMFVDADMIKENAKLTNTEDLRGGTVNLNLEYIGREDVESRDIKDKVILYDIWDKKLNRNIIIAKGIDKFLFNEEIPYQMEGLPFSVLTFYKNPDELFTVSHVETIASHQAELNELTNLQLSHVKRVVHRKMLIGGGAAEIDQATMAKLLAPIPQIIPINADINNMKEFPNMNLPVDFYNMLNQVKSNIREISGVDELQRGGANPRETATAANIRSQFQSAKTFYMSAKIEEFIEDIATKVLQLDQQFLDTAIAIKIAGQQGEEWKKLTKEDIQGEFGVYVEAGSITKSNKDILRKQWVDLLNLLGGIQSPEFSMNLEAIVTEVLKAFEVKDPKKFFLPPPQPQIQEEVPLPSSELGAINPEGAGRLPRMAGNSPALAPQQLNTGVDNLGGLEGNVMNLGM